MNTDTTTQQAPTQQPGAASGGDALDKGVDYLERREGHEQVRRVDLDSLIIV
jgi:hypothetical protein